MEVNCNTLGKVTENLSFAGLDGPPGEREELVSKKNSNGVTNILISIFKPHLKRIIRCDWRVVGGVDNAYMSSVARFFLVCAAWLVTRSHGEWLVLPLVPFSTPHL